MMQENIFKCVLIYLQFFSCVFIFSTKQKAKELGATNQEYAQTALNLINPRTPEKRVAIRDISKFHPCRALFYEELEEMQYDMENELSMGQWSKCVPQCQKLYMMM